MYLEHSNIHCTFERLPQDRALWIHQTVSGQSQDRRWVNSPKWMNEKNMDIDSTGVKKLNKTQQKSPAVEDATYHALAQNIPSY